MNIPSIDLDKTGQRIKQARINSGLSINEVKETLGFMNPQCIYRWEKGKTVPTIDNLVAIARLYGVKVDDLIATIN